MKSATPLSSKVISGPPPDSCKRTWVAGALNEEAYRVIDELQNIARELDMPQAWCDEIRFSAQLHDVGKMSVDSAVLKNARRVISPVTMS